MLFFRVGSSETKTDLQGHHIIRDEKRVYTYGDSFHLTVFEAFVADILFKIKPKTKKLLSQFLWNIQQ